jgi:RNA polymerase sigma-70 factor (TIGR02943 family)
MHGRESNPTRTTAPSTVTGDDPTAWLDDHGDALFAFAMARVGNVEAAEDLVQDALLAAITNRDQFQNHSTVRTWLIGILKHKIVDWHRRAGALQRRAAPPPKRVSSEELERWVDAQFGRGGKWRVPPKAWSGEPHAAIEQDEFRAVLWRCIEKLPEASGDALLLAERQGLNAEHLARVLQITTNHVGVMLYRARSALRRCLEVHWFKLKDG